MCFDVVVVKFIELIGVCLWCVVFFGGMVDFVGDFGYVGGDIECMLLVFVVVVVVDVVDVCVWVV